MNKWIKFYLIVALVQLLVCMVQASNISVSADYDGDKVIDPAVYESNSGTWTIRLSNDNYHMYKIYELGGTNYIPCVGDYDGDRKADFAIFEINNGTWIVKLSKYDYKTFVIYGFGGTNYGKTVYVPCVADYDGDKKDDPAIVSKNGWQIMLSSCDYCLLYW